MGTQATPVSTPVSSRHRFRAMAGAVPFWLYPAALLTAVVVIRGWGDRWWGGALLCFGPRWILVLPAFVLAPLALRLRRRRLLWPVGLGVALGVGPLMGLCVPVQRVFSPTPAGPTLRVMTLNAHRASVDPGKLAAYLATEQPDVVAFQDWTDKLRASVGDLGPWQVHRDGELYLATRFPIREVTDLRLEHIWPAGLPGEPRVAGGAAVDYVLDTPVGVVHVISLHLASPHTAFNTFLEGDDAASQIEGNSRMRRQQSAQIRDYVLRIRGPVLLAGDFNTPGDSPIFRASWYKFSDAFSAVGFGFGYTHYARWSQTRIDHILAGAGWRCRRSWVGPNLGSPHRPLFAEVEWVGDR